MKIAAKSTQDVTPNGHEVTHLLTSAELGLNDRGPHLQRDVRFKPLMASTF